MPIIIKKCKKHGDTEYSVYKTGSKCRKCMYEAVKRRRYKVKVMALEYKGNCCQDCGYDRCPAALEFHHLDPNCKDFEVGSSTHNKSWELVKKELDKCALLCSNCHREAHWLTQKLLEVD